MKRKLLSILLTLCLAFSLLPTAALAAEGETSGEVVQQGSSVSLPENNRGNFTISEEGAVLDGTGVTYTDGTITVTAADVTIKNLIFGDKAKLVVNTSGKFTLTGCTFAPQTVYDKATKLPVRTAVNLNVGEAEVTNNTFEGVTNGYYNAIEFGIGAGDNDLKAATISGNTFKSAIANNYFSFYNMTNGAQIDIVNNKLLLAAKSSNGIRISNYRNATGVTFNIDSDEYTYATDSADSEYEGLILLQDYSKDSAVQNFSDITLNVTNLTAPESAKQLLYVYDNQAGIISTNQPVVKGDSSIEKFFVAKVSDTYYKTLADAVAAAQGGQTVKLLTNTTVSASMLISKDITIDLNGKQIKTECKQAFKIVAKDRYAGGSLKVTGEGTIDANNKNGTFFLVGTETSDSTKKSTLMIDKNVKLINGAYAVWVHPTGSVNASYNVKVDIYGSLSGIEPIYVHGNVEGTQGNVPVIWLHDGANIEVTRYDLEVYIGGYAKVIIDKATITNTVKDGNALTISAGELEINGATIIGGDTVGKNVAGGGGAVDVTASSAVFVKQHTTNLPLKITINDGTFKAAVPFNQAAGQATTPEPGKITLSIKGGYFVSTGSAADGSVAVKSADKTGFISGGYFTSDPSAYVANGYVAGTSDVSGYSYKVVEKTNTGSVEVKPAVAEPEVKVSGNIAENDKTAVENAAKTVSAPTLGAAAADEAQKIDETKANDLIKAATNLGDGEKKLYVQSALKVEPTAYDKESKTLTLEITPQYRIVASTADKADNIELSGNSRNAQVVQDYQKLTITAPTVVTMNLPSDFAVENGAKLSIKHIKDNGTVEYYTGVVSETAGTKTLTFTTNGFSPFTISAPAASIGETMYPTLAEAIAKAANGSTIRLEKACDESVSVSGKSLTINKNGKTYDFGKVTVDSNSTKTENGDILTITYTAPSSSSGSSGYYVSTPSKTEHGTVTVSPRYADKGDTVTVTVKPDSGYVLETLTVTDKNGDELTLKDKGNGKYTFTMPAGKVEVKATFMEDNSMLNFFYDVPNNAYFYEAVKWAVENGITTGVGNNLFAPEQPCTRAQIVTFLWRAAGSPEPKGAASGMTDVVSGSYYEKAVAWAIENGITTGTTTSTFSPDATCTRAQAVTFLARALNAKAASAAEFSDVPTDSYFADAVAWAAANGVTEGIGGGLFGSDNDCTRGQIVTFLYRAYNK